jgi:flagellar biosynthesis/type III secretory pathway protein FliH
MTDDLMKKWREAETKSKELLKVIRMLREQIEEADRKRETAVKNAYEEGFNAGREEALRLVNQKHAR